MSEITLDQLTTGALNGTGVFDVLMRASKEHLDAEFKKGSIRGTEYATVYLGQLDQAMQTGLNFLAQKQRIGLEATLLEKQIALADKQLAIAQAQLEQTQAQTALVEKQIEKANAELVLIPKQGALLDQQITNAEVEKRVLEGQVCKLQGEFDLIQQNVLKTGSEIGLLNQKIATEKAQILNVGVDPDSVVGKQKTLYTAQADGFKRDAEQKVAQLYVDVFKTLRMTDDAFPPSADAGLDAVTMGRVLKAARTGVGVT